MELIVVLAILGIVAAVSGLTLSSLQAPRESEWIRQLRHARAEAIRIGVPVRAVLPSPPFTALHRLPPPLFLPDGRAIGSGVDPFTGAPRDSAR